MELLKYAQGIAQEERNCILKDSKVLREDYIPEQIIQRKRELELLADKVYAMPLIDRPGTHLFIYGKPGTGKSLTNQYLIHQLKETIKDKALPSLVIYLNCSDHKSTRSIFKCLYEQVSNKVLSNVDTSGYYHAFLDSVDKNLKYITIILDEIDKVKGIDEIDRLLYLLLRYRECHDLKDSDLWITLVAISNDMLLKEKLKEGTQSSFGINWLHYKRYTADQLFAILKHRSENAFSPDIISDELIHEIAAYLEFHGGDARQGISILKNMSAIAESANDHKLEKRHFEKSLEVMEERSIKAELINLSKQEQYVYFAFTCAYLNSVDQKKEQYATIGDIYLAYRAITETFKTGQLSERQVRNYLDQFDNKTGLLKKIKLQGMNYYSPTFDSSIAFNIWKEFQGEKKGELDHYFRQLIKEREALNMMERPTLET